MCKGRTLTLLLLLCWLLLSGRPGKERNIGRLVNAEEGGLVAAALMHVRLLHRLYCHLDRNVINWICFQTLSTLVCTSVAGFVRYATPKGAFTWQTIHACDKRTET
jgi:hypothetical protein